MYNVLNVPVSAESFNLVTQSYKGSCMYCRHMTHDSYSLQGPVAATVCRDDASASLPGHGDQWPAPGVTRCQGNARGTVRRGQSNVNFNGSFSGSFDKICFPRKTKTSVEQWHRVHMI